jgi:hypothetical protein
MTGQTYVYFIRATHTGLIKIGLSDEPWRRIRQLQAVNADDLVMLGFRIGSLELEHAYHIRFKAHRQQGEWFMSTPELMEEVAAARATRGMPFDEASTDVGQHYVSRRLKDRPLIAPHARDRFAWAGDGFWQGWEGF